MYGLILNITTLKKLIEKYQGYILNPIEFVRIINNIFKKFCKRDVERFEFVAIVYSSLFV